jgi:hypothetical protein
MIMSLKINIAKLIDTAFQRCGVSTPLETPEQILRAKEAIYYTLLDMYNRGTVIFGVVPEILGLQPLKWKYDLSDKTVDLYNVLWRQYNHTGTTPSGGNDPVYLQDYNWQTFATTSDFFELTLNNPPSYISYWGIVPYGTYTASFVVEATQSFFGTDVKWASRDMSFSGSWRSIAYGNSRFVAVAFQSNKFALSLDGGNSWQESSTVDNLQWNAITHNGRSFIAVAQNSATVLNSSDGENWIHASMPIVATWNTLISNLKNGRVVALSLEGNLAYSDDNGNTWISLPSLPAGNWISGCYGANGFVAISTNGTQSAFSVDGINWSNTNLPSSLYWQDVAYCEVINSYVAVSSNGSPYIATSSNGVSWNLVDIGIEDNWSAISYGAGIITIVAFSSQTAIQSIDGSNWEISELPVPASWTALTFGDGTFITCATGGAIAAIDTEEITVWTKIAEYVDYQFVDGEWLWADMITPVLSSIVRIRLTEPGELRFRGFFIGDLGRTYEIPSAKMNRDTFATYPNKGAQGTPLNYFFLKDNTPQIQLWQAPNMSSSFKWALSIYSYKVPEIDFALPLELPVPDWYLDGLGWGVAARLSFTLPSIDPQRMQFIQTQFEKFLNQAEYNNSDTSPLNLLGNMLSGYQGYSGGYARGR